MFKNAGKDFADSLPAQVSQPMYYSLQHHTDTPTAPPLLCYWIDKKSNKESHSWLRTTTNNKEYRAIKFKII